MTRQVTQQVDPFPRSAESYRQLLELANDAVFVADAVSGILVEANHKASELIGRPVEQIIGMHQADLHPPDKAEEYRDIFTDYVSQGRGITWELLVRHASGSDIPVEISANVVEVEGRIFLTGIFRDLRSRSEAKKLSDDLNEINQIINSTLDINEVVGQVVSTSSGSVGAESTAFLLVQNTDWVLTHVHGRTPYDVGAKIPLQQLGGVETAINTKRPVAISDAQNDERSNAAIARKIGFKSLMVVPLLAGDTVLGVLVFRYMTEQRDFTYEEVDFCDKLGSSISLAIENARLYTEQHNIANTLQRALLIVPENLPGLDFGHVYRSATEATIVGGDFYDLFTLDGDRVGLVIGDVSGKGLEAATLTSSLKHMIKAYAYEGHSPAAIVEKTNGMAIRETDSSTFVTVFVGIIDTRSGILTYCCAGHPPPIIKRQGGGVELLETSCPALGVLDWLETRESRELMRPADVLTLYTDGVTEARCEVDMFGESRLLEFISGADFSAASEVPQAILEELSQHCGCILADDLAIVSLGLLDQNPDADEDLEAGFAKRISAAGTVTDVVGFLVEELTGELGVSGASVFLCDPEKGQLRGHLGWPERLFPEIAKVAIALDDPQSATALAVRTCMPVVVEDAANSSLTKKWLVRNYGIRACAVLPMIMTADVLGCVVAIDKERIREFPPEDIARAQALIDQAVKAIQAL